MAARFNACAGGNSCTVFHHRHALSGSRPARCPTFSSPAAARVRASSSSSGSSSSTSGSYLDMWKKAMERERRAQVLSAVLTQQDTSPHARVGEDSLDRKAEEFNRILQVPPEERDRVQRLQVIDRAAAAIAAAQALLKDKSPPPVQETGVYGSGASTSVGKSGMLSGETPKGPCLEDEDWCG